ncbi:MAG: primase C-terminal domain-containing protein [Ignavibacteriae bacterium]|nr:primase C-terminal domain-containing protein [Ignavibacteriota bacterium]
MQNLLITNAFLTLMVTFGLNVKNPTALELLPMAEIINKITYDQELKTLVGKLREINDHGERAEFKAKNLPYFTLNKFSNKRSKENFISTQAMVFDIDHLENVEEIKSYLSKWKYTSAVFISPSGNGLKLIVKLNRPITANNEYERIYLNLVNLIEKEFNVNLDRSTKDSARACFLSFDPAMYINELAEAINIDEGEFLNNYVLVNTPPPINKRDEIKEILCGVEEGRRHSSMIKLIGAYIKQGLTKPQILQSLQSWNLLNQPPLDESELNTEFERAYKNFSKNQKPKFKKFWSYHEKKGIVIEENEFIDFLEEQGFYKMKYGFDTYEFVKIDEHIIQKVSITEIQEYVKYFIINNVDENDKDELLNKIVTKTKEIFYKQKFNFLTTINPEIIKDEQNKAYLFFQDAYFEISADNIKRNQYSSADQKYVWSGNIIRRNCGLYRLDYMHNNSTFNMLIKNITRNEEQWYNALISSIGYLLHSYKNPAKAKAIIFCDESIPIGNDANGGSGKSLVCSSLNYLRKTTIFDGKNYNTESRFTFQKIETDTKVVILDDVRKKFDFESLLSAITSDLVVERKFKDPITIPFEDAPKFVITTNYTINGNGNSFDRRKHEIEFSNYYRKGFSPDMEFGHRLFDEWNDEQWEEFYITMIGYIQFYLKNGLQTYSVKNLPVRKIINTTGQDFYDFMLNYVKLDEEYNKAELVESFRLKYPDCSKWTSRWFSSCITVFTNNMEYELSERQSNGNRYIIITNPNQKEAAIENTDDSEIDITQIF